MKKTVVISSVIEKEDKFLEYRYAAKLAAESLGYTVRRNNEDFVSVAIKDRISPARHSIAKVYRS